MATLINFIGEALTCHAGFHPFGRLLVVLLQIDPQLRGVRTKTPALALKEAPWICSFFA